MWYTRPGICTHMSLHRVQVTLLYRLGDLNVGRSSSPVPKGDLTQDPRTYLSIDNPLQVSERAALNCLGSRMCDCLLSFFPVL